MNMIEMQPTVFAPAFPVPSDTRPPSAATYLDHSRPSSSYGDGSHISQAYSSPTSQKNSSPRSYRSQTEISALQPDGQASPPGIVAGKKRSADGTLKATPVTTTEASTLTQTGHSRNASNVSTTSNATVVELSQQLRTRLTYAMIKVQHGWQNRSLDEVESLASASPRSTAFNTGSDNRHILSPREVMTAQLSRQSSGSSSDSGNHPSSIHTAPAIMSPPKKGLAPPANIVSRPTQHRRRPTPNMQLQTGTTAPSPSRPAVKHRTPSQNAAMEADAVETLLFMASPNNSGHQSSQFSPVTSAPSLHHFPSQTSPLRNTFSAPTSPKRVAFARHGGHTTRFSTDKNAVIASIVEKLDEDGEFELDEALKIANRHLPANSTT